MKTGSFPRDDTHVMTLVLHDGQRRSISVIPPETPKREATDLLDAVAGAVGGDRTSWENEGGHA